MKRALLLFALCLTTATIFAQTTLQGTVTDADNGDPLISASVALYKDGNLVTGNITDFDGNFYFSNIDPGEYDLLISYTGFADQRLEGIGVLAGRSNVADVELSQGVNMDVVTVVGYKEPLVEQDNTTQGSIVTSEEIRQLPTRNINALASTGAGVASADEGGALSIRGSRPDATFYYVDGIRVQGNLIQESEIEQLQTVIGGVPAQYGDVTGGFISITTKGPSNRFGGGVEIETSDFLDDFGQSLLGFNLSGPLLKRANDKNTSILGFRLAGRYTLLEDDRPSAVPLYRVNDDALAELEANPLVVRNRGNGQFAPFVAADFYDNDDVSPQTTRPFEESTRADIRAILDARLSDAIDVTLTGFYSETENQFTPTDPNGAFWRVYNSHNNPTRFDTDYRASFRLRHRLGRQGGDGSDQGLIQNASYTLQFGYENNSFDVSDQRHGENYFAYGHVAEFDVDYVPVFAALQSSMGGDSLVHVDYRPVLANYNDGNSSNPVLANYNNIYGVDALSSENLYGSDFAFSFQPTAPIQGESNIFIPQSVNGFVATNGATQSLYNTAWNIHSNVGSVYNTVSRGDNDIFTFNANASLELVPGGGNNAKNRHSIQFGIMYEQRTIRGYTVSPRGLWTLGRQLSNQHLVSVSDQNRVIEQLDIDASSNILGASGSVDVYAPTVTDLPGQFYLAARERFGLTVDQFFNIDEYAPEDLTLDLFSAKELNDAGLIGYTGYDYLGNEFNGSFDDFFTIDPQTGDPSFNVAPFRPIYSSAYIQDKFTLNDMIFRLGVRVDRYDANTKVLRDPYSLYALQGAADFHSGTNTERPGAIGDDFAVYTTSQGSNSVQAYRDGDNWFLADGSPVNGPQEIDGIRSGLVFPVYENPLAESSVNLIKEDAFRVEDSFEDYEVQINVMPRLSFSFPISDASNFFAHYDVLVQRPAGNNIATARTYYYFVERPGTSRNPISNPNLRPETTIDYEVGFQQRLTNSSALKVSAYYKELRDNIQQRTYFPVPLVNQYTTFDNQDFGTTKGFNITYDLRRTNNVQINANYSLAFADGTGSDANSQRGLTNRGNIRTLFPLNFDERHRINFILDYRLDDRTQGVFKNFGVNLQAIGVSGRPYTQTQVPSQFGGTGTVGAVNGARKPWTFRLNLRVDKQIDLGNGMGVNVYFRVTNLLDRRNVLNVYSVTGSPEDSGWLQSSFGQDFLANTESQTVPVESFLASYQWSLLQPGFFSLPRQMFMGAIVNF
ncbi:MAG: carboxypeptidase regulatory-like domain-containing protein [Bacteroidota bacterium]